jgi:polysaccharide biosynthesis protein PslH
MRILVLGSRVPYPLHDGGAVATYQTLKLLSENNELVYFTYNTAKHYQSKEVIKERFPFCKVITQDLDASFNPAKAILALFSGESYNIQRFISPKANAALARLLKKRTFDLVHFEGLYTTPFLETVKANFNGPTLLRQHNIEYQIWEKLAATSRGIKKWYLQALSRTLKDYEQNILPKFDQLVGISPEDTVFLITYNHKAQCISVAQELHSPINKLVPYSICHIGSMEWQPNIQAVKWFVNQVWPQVLAKFPQAKFHMAGKGLNPRDKQFQAPGIVNHGQVDSASEFMRNYGMMVIPLQSASGVRVKALEAMANGLCIVSTPVGLSGVAVTNQAKVCDSAQDMADAIIYLFQNPQQAHEYGQAAHTFIQQNYSLQVLKTQWDQCYSALSQ